MKIKNCKNTNTIFDLRNYVLHEDAVEIFNSLTELVNYLKPTKELMNDEFRAILIKAEEALEKAKI